MRSAPHISHRSGHLPTAPSISQRSSHTRSVARENFLSRRSAQSCADSALRPQYCVKAIPERREKRGENKIIRRSRAERRKAQKSRSEDENRIRIGKKTAHDHLSHDFCSAVGKDERRKTGQRKRARERIRISRLSRQYEYTANRARTRGFARSARASESVCAYRASRRVRYTERLHRQTQRDGKRCRRRKACVADSSREPPHRPVTQI